jgi:uroporphyrinogen-III synthase
MMAVYHTFVDNEMGEHHLFLLVKAASYDVIHVFSAKSVLQFCREGKKECPPVVLDLTQLLVGQVL